MKERLKDLIAKNYQDKKINESNKLLLKNRKEVDINAHGTSGYKIKQGTNEGKIVGHISIKPKDI